MKIEIEAYDLNQELFTMKDDKVTSFRPVGLYIESEYSGYTGDNWGDTCYGKGGYPIKIYYKDADKMIRHHSQLHPSVDKLLKWLVSS